MLLVRLHHYWQARHCCRPLLTSLTWLRQLGQQPPRGRQPQLQLRQGQQQQSQPWYPVTTNECRNATGVVVWVRTFH